MRKSCSSDGNPLGRAATDAMARNKRWLPDNISVREWTGGASGHQKRRCIRGNCVTKRRLECGVLSASSRRRNPTIHCHCPNSGRGMVQDQPWAARSAAKLTVPAGYCSTEPTHRNSPRTPGATFAARKARLRPGVQRCINSWTPNWLVSWRPCLEACFRCQ